MAVSSRGPRFVAWAIVLLMATILIPVAAQSTYGSFCTDTPATVHKCADTAVALHFWAVVTFIADLLAVALVVLGIGFAVTGRPLGIALSTWNDYSLSRLQMALWTILVIAALLTAAKLNLLGYFGPLPDLSANATAHPQALDIGIPGELLAAMGIAAFSTAATPAILSLKASQTPAPGEVPAAHQRMADTAGVPAGTMSNAGMTFRCG